MWIAKIQIRLGGCFAESNKYDPKRQKMYPRTCTPSEDSDQPAITRSLIRIFTGDVLTASDAKILQADNEVSDRTVQMRRLI